MIQIELDQFSAISRRELVETVGALEGSLIKDWKVDDECLKLVVGGNGDEANILEVLVDASGVVPIHASIFSNWISK